MGGEWPLVRLEDLVEIRHGYAFRGDLIREDAVGDVLLTPGNFRPGGGFTAAKMKYYDGPVPEDFVLRDGDLLVTMTDLSRDVDTLGYPALVPRPRGRYRYLHNQRLGKLVSKPGGDLSLRFLYYVLCGAEYRSEVLAGATGTTVKHTAPSRIGKFRFRIPPRDYQSAIARILGALDDKIDLNRQTSETMEAMARALFGSWSEEHEDTRKKAADLVSEGILEIGDGYRAKNSELGAPGLPFVRAGDLDSGFNLAGAEVLSEESVAKAGSKVGSSGDVAFTSKGTIGRFARVSSHTPRFVYSPQVCYWRSLDRERLHPAILYCWMVGDGFRAQIDAVAGQTDMAPYVSLRDQRQMEVPVFPSDQAVVGDEIETFLERQSLLAHESDTLAALRDTLLPKLISGELRIPDAERMVGEVA